MSESKPNKCPICGGKTSKRKVLDYQNLLSEFNQTKKELSETKSKLMTLQAEVNVIDQSNKLMEAELERKRKQLDALHRKSQCLREELYELKSRGFWKRLFNM